jgi:hypothetical protein
MQAALLQAETMQAEMMRVEMTPAEPRSPRPDTETSRIVETGISLLQSRGRAFASEFMVRRNIPFSVIVRVLSDPPWRRRARSLGR